jgi:membrane-associated phospholipid phosphatase
VGTFCLPALLIFLLLRSGVVRSVYLHDRNDRRLPYLLTGLVYAGLTYLFGFRLQLVSTFAPVFAVLMGSTTLSILLVGLINLYWKISAHGVGVGGTVGAIAGLLLRFGENTLLLPLAIAIVLAGAVATARLQLNAHTPAQVAAGVSVGALVSAGAIVWWL